MKGYKFRIRKLKLNFGIYVLFNNQSYGEKKMSIKVFGDTLRLSEFSNQRFLYGHLITSFYGITLSTMLILWINPLEINYLPIMIYTGLIALVFAYITNQFSRKLLFKISRAESSYEKLIREEYDFDELLENIKEEKIEEKLINQLGELFIKVSLKDFRKIFEENYFSPSETQEQEELRRIETVILLGIWMIIWSCIVYFLSIMFYREETISISLFNELTTVDLYNLISFIMIIVIAAFLIIFFISRSYYFDKLISALPLFYKGKELRKKARIIATGKFMNDFLLSENENKYSNLKNILEKEFEENIREFFRKIHTEDKIQTRFFEEVKLVSKLPEKVLEPYMNILNKGREDDFSDDEIISKETQLSEASSNLSSLKRIKFLKNKKYFKNTIKILVFIVIFQIFSFSLIYNIINEDGSFNIELVYIFLILLMFIFTSYSVPSSSRRKDPIDNFAYIAPFLAILCMIIIISLTIFNDLIFITTTLIIFSLLSNVLLIFLLPIYILQVLLAGNIINSLYKMGIDTKEIALLINEPIGNLLKFTSEIKD